MSIERQKKLKSRMLIQKSHSAIKEKEMKIDSYKMSDCVLKKYKLVLNFFYYTLRRQDIRKRSKKKKKH